MLGIGVVRAFVVEDNAGIREIVADLLTRRGHVVSAFHDAESAWAEIGDAAFDLAVLDWGLPGIDGLELCRRLRGRAGGERGCIVMLTGRAEPDDLDEVVASGANDYVTKPFKLDVLETRIAFAERQVAGMSAGGPAAAAAETRDHTGTALAHRERERQYRELVVAAERQADQLKLLDRIRSALAGAVELPSVLRIVVEATAEILGYHYTSLYLREGDHLMLQHQVGYEDASRIYYIVPITAGISGGVVRTGIPALIDNAPANPDFLCALDDVVYEICVPLRDGDRIAGVFNVETKADQPLTDDDLRLLLGVAEHVNGAISRARLVVEARESEQRLRSVLDSVREVVFQADAEGRWVFLNRAWEEITGFTVAESLGREVSSFGLPERRGAFDEAVRELASGGQASLRGDFQIVTASGEHRWVAANAHRSGDLGPPFAIIGTLIDVTERKSIEEALRISEERYRHLAMHDFLTTLPNRSLFTERLDEALSACTDGSCAISVLFLDLDGFKLVNDGWGHDVGDQLLVQVGQRLRACIRPQDTVARLGGDEFAILICAAPESAIARETAELVLAAFNAPYSLNDQEIVLATSVGIAVHTGPGGSTNGLLRNADTALYAAKSGGRGVIAAYRPRVTTANLLRLHKGHDLRDAIETGDLHLNYLPSFDLLTGEIVGLEALVRWLHPDHGLLTPAELAAHAEASGLTVPLGEAVLRAVCHELRAWRSRARKPIPRITLGLAARQLREPGLANAIAATLDELGIDPGAVTFEFGEQAASSEGVNVLRAVHGLRQLGVGLTVNDFGVGHASLTSLTDLPVDGVKIAQSFVWALGRDRASTAIVSAIKTLASAMGLAVTAAGIDTGDHLAQVRLAGIERGQGHHLSQPLDETEVASILDLEAPVAADLLAVG
jgi:diguanylate cyclase (GGDEF)-like protein/PAS domain S-box-containing protein